MIALNESTKISGPVGMPCPVPAAAGEAQRGPASATPLPVEFVGASHHETRTSGTSPDGASSNAALDFKERADLTRDGVSQSTPGVQPGSSGNNPDSRSNFVGDSVPNAGDANCEIQAGSQNTTSSPSLLRVTEEATGVIEPMSQSSLRADNFSQAGAAMLPEENSGRTTQGGPATSTRDWSHETPAACDSDLAEKIIELFDGEVGRPKDEDRIKEANRRLDVLKTFNQLTKPLFCGKCEHCRNNEQTLCVDQGRGLTKAAAALEIGEPYTNIWRYQKAYDATGYNGLIPDTANCGRKNVFETLGFSPEQVQQIIDELKGIELDTDSVTSALRIFASSGRCPDALADVILNPNRSSKHKLPPSLREAAKNALTTKEAHRGPRTLKLNGFYIPRKMDVIAGDVFTGDDTTPIWGWWVPWRECDEYPFGVKLLQGQWIPALDVASQNPLGGVLIAREKASYRASDIWHLFGHVFDTVGLPRLGWQLERGSWQANVIRGQEIEYRDGEATYSRRIGGLRQLPCNPHDQVPEGFTWPKTLQTFTSYLPKSKSIEAFFNRSQTLEGTLWGALGRDQMRRPFEKAKKIFQACQRGAADPRNHFLSHEEIAKHITAMMDYLANEPMEGEVFKGIPRVNFDAAVAERPLFQFKGVPELEELRWLYRRDWSVVTITQGWARLRLTHPLSGERYSLFYTNAAVFAHHEGEQVAVYYDRENFQDSAQIVLARTGEYLCEAQYVERTGSFLGTDRTGQEAAKAWRNAVMSTYITLAQHAPSRQLPPEIATRRSETRRAAQLGTPAPALVPAIVDGRPAAVAPQHNPFAPATAVQQQKQQNRISRQAVLAKRLRQLGGEE